MNMTRKFASLLLAMILVLCAVTPAMAATISVPETDKHTYSVYQIFTGDLSDKVLSNVKWGKNGTGATGEAVDGDILKELENVSTNISHTEKLKAIEKYVNLNGEAFGTVSSTAALQNVPDGYYLIKDNGKVEEGEAYSRYVVQIVKDTVIQAKRENVKSEKKVKDTNDTSGATSDWQDSADYDIGDAVPFQLKGTVTADYADYTSYYFAFHDKLADGLTFNADSVKVMIDNVAVETGFELVTGSLTDGCTFEVRFADLKTIESVKANSVITVEYTAQLNDKAVTGTAGNANKMQLEYSNNPNTDASGDKGKTPEDTVVVFTYKVIANKTNTNNEPLKGAGFTLYKKNAEGNYVAVGTEVKGEDMTTFTWTGLDDGDYKLEETTTPPGYNTIAPIEFTITATHDITSANPALTALAGGTGFTVDLTAGSLTTTIVNQAGSTLPETGGMGTTLFYVVGGVLVVAAFVLLVTKRRVGAEK